MTSEIQRLLDAELAAVELEHHDMTMRLGHDYLEEMGTVDADAFREHCRSQGHIISLYNAESVLEYYANTLIGESHD